MSFHSLGMHQLLTKRVVELGYEKPTPIQEACFSAIIAGHDVMAGAQTGTGKTAAFALPILQRLIEHNTSIGQRHSTNKVSTLVLTPTRELAQQVYCSFVKYSEGIGVQSVAVYGGASINPQLDAIRQGCDVLVATPGRLLELITKNLVDLSEVRTLVLDEADRMLDMGFIVDIKLILKSLPSSKQTLLFSATFNEEIFAVSKAFLNAPQLIEVDQRNATASKVEQVVYQVDKHRKSGLLSYLIGSRNWQQVLIFTRTKLGADQLAKEMEKDGIAIQSIHGDKSQGARDRILTSFKEGKIRALVATDVAARGVDIKQLQYVINHELPYNAEDYIHRIGRTGRAGLAGLAVSLVSEKEHYLLAEIEKLLGENFVPQWLEGFEPQLSSQDDNKRQNAKSKKTLRAQSLGTIVKHNKSSRRRR